MKKQTLKIIVQFTFLVIFMLLLVKAGVSYCNSYENEPVNPGNSEDVTMKKDSANSEKFAVSFIRYLNQNKNGRSSWCVVYSTTMLLSRWGIEVEPGEVAGKLEMETRDTPYFSFKSVFAREGSVELYLQNVHNLETRKKIFVTLRPYLEQWIKDNINRDRPILAMYHRVQGHAVVIVGYDDEYLYFNDPSGALFYSASNTLEKDALPKVWLSENRSSRFEGAGLKWEDFREFLRLQNILGLMIVVTGRNKSPGIDYDAVRKL
jgi:hypothetical protein